MCGGQVATGDRPDRAGATDPAAQHAVVVEHRDTVGGEPHVALQTVGAEAKGQLERLERVLRGVRPGPAVAEGDRVVEERGEPLLHAWHGATPRTTTPGGRSVVDSPSCSTCQEARWSSC